jgi:hypothetical protein
MNMAGNSNLADIVDGQVLRYANPCPVKSPGMALIRYNATGQKNNILGRDGDG